MAKTSASDIAPNRILVNEVFIALPTANSMPPSARQQLLTFRSILHDWRAESHCVGDFMVLQGTVRVSIRSLHGIGIAFAFLTH